MLPVIRQVKISFVLVASLLTVLSFVLPAPVSGQPVYSEEIIVRLEIPRLLEKDIFVQYDGERIYVPLIELFQLLQIRIIPDFVNKRFAGDYLNSDKRFEIDLIRSQARSHLDNITLEKNSYFLTATDLYLSLSLYEQLFELKLSFNFSELTVFLPLNKEFPSYTMLKRKLAYKRLQEQKVTARDTYSIPYQRRMFRAGAADWTISASPVGSSTQNYHLGLGAMFLGGDLSLSGGGNSKFGWFSEQFNYRWHYYFENNPYLTQAIVGKNSAGGALTRNLEGIMVSSRPEIRRKYFQTVTLEGHTGEGWDVELWVNGKLIDYTRTDQNGDYSFLVDINYGTTRTMIKKYGPNGEVQIDEQYLNVPFNLIPKGEFEYTVVAGQQEQQQQKKTYAQATTSYGLLRNFTVGLSADLPINSEDSEDKAAFAFESSYRLRGDLFLSSSYSPGNLVKGGLTYSHPDLVNTSLSYIKYSNNPAFNTLGRLYTSVVSLSAPLKIFSGHRLSLRFRGSMTGFNGRTILNMNYGFGTSLSRIYLNYYGNLSSTRYSDRSARQMSSQIMLLSSFVRWIRPQIKLNYDHALNQLAKAGLYINKRVFRRGQLTLSAERNMLTGANTFMLTFRHQNNFAEFTSRLVSAAKRLTMVQTQKGSVIFNQDSRSFYFNRVGGVGYGSAVIRPFLDENFNGVKDLSEPVLPGLKAKMRGASGRKSNDNLYFYDRLRPYDRYLIEIDRYSLDNPLLLPSHESYSVSVNPNTVTAIDVPIVMAGEITGMVEREIPDGLIGIGGVKILIVNEITGRELEITSFNNGEFFYLGLPPGLYRATLDFEQLTRSGYVAQPASRSFQVKTIEGGDLIENLNFLLKRRAATPSEAAQDKN